MIYQIKIENNSKQILKYLEILGYTWQTGDKPTEWIPNVPHYCFVVYEDDMKISYSSKNETISFEEFKRQNPIQKKHLRSGMVIEYANGDRRLVTEIEGNLLLISEDGFKPLESYNEDLIIDHEDININKVGFPKLKSGLYNMLEHVNFIWERPNPVIEVTLEEIAEKFGVDVKQLKIKK